MWLLLAIIVLSVPFLFLVKGATPSKKSSTIDAIDAAEIRSTLEESVPFFPPLSDQSKNEFILRVHEFLTNITLTWVDCSSNNKDSILIAASAIIPVFQFSNWSYYFLEEVIIYPKAFNKKYETGTETSTIMGMVGNGPLKGKVLLSQEAIRHGFWNSTDKLNTAIHEFVHLIDGADGKMDGVPLALLKKEEIGPWMEMVRSKSEEIDSEKTGISKYALKNEAEFFTVVSEYFFERPKLLQKKHPKLFTQLDQIYDAHR